MTLKRKTLTIPEAAKVLGIGRSAAYEAARQRQLPTIQIGRRKLVPTVALDRLLAGAEGTSRLDTATGERTGIAPLDPRRSAMRTHSEGGRS